MKIVWALAMDLSSGVHTAFKRKPRFVFDFIWHAKCARDGERWLKIRFEKLRRLLPICPSQLATCFLARLQFHHGATLHINCVTKHTHTHTIFCSSPICWTANKWEKKKPVLFHRRLRSTICICFHLRRWHTHNLYTNVVHIVARDVHVKTKKNIYISVVMCLRQPNQWR